MWPSKDRLEGIPAFQIKVDSEMEVKITIQLAPGSALEGDVAFKDELKGIPAFQIKENMRMEVKITVQLAPDTASEEDMAFEGWVGRSVYLPSQGR
jgi:hypothetical protein